MPLYQCSVCSMIITVSKALTSPKRGKCNGWLAQICQPPDPVSYLLKGLDFREKVKQMDRVGPILPSRQIHQKSSVTTEASKEKNINGESLLNSGRIQNTPIPSSLPVNRPPQTLKEILHNARQREEERTPKTGSSDLQDLPGFSEDLRLIVEEVKQVMLELLGGQALKRTLGPKDPWLLNGEKPCPDILVF